MRREPHDGHGQFGGCPTWWERLLQTGFRISVAFAIFMAGAFVAIADIFPSPILASAYRGGMALYDQWTSYDDVYATDLWHPARTDETGASVRDAKRMQQGLTLYTSGHEAAAFLIDANGKVLHQWKRPFSSVWTKDAAVRTPRPDTHVYFRKARVFPNGDLLAIYEAVGDTPYGYGMVKLDRHSNVIWSYLENTHHDFDIAPDGRIFVLTHELTTEELPEFAHLGPPRIDDFLVVLSPSGQELMKISLTETVARSPYAHLLHTVSWYSVRDPLHTNAVDFVGQDAAKAFPYAQAGQILLSFRELRALGVLDIDEGRIVWATQGYWIGQHDPDILADGNILLFDNYGRHEQPGGRSRVIEFDARTMELTWQYAGDADQPFASAIRSSQQRLANGNTLITESNGGRILEVTRQGETVWEFVNPQRGGASADKVPIVCWAERYSQSYFVPDFLQHGRV